MGTPSAKDRPAAVTQRAGGWIGPPVMLPKMFGLKTPGLIAARKALLCFLLRSIGQLVPRSSTSYQMTARILR